MLIGKRVKPFSILKSTGSIAVWHYFCYNIDIAATGF
jgi:hypothetical protein